MGKYVLTRKHVYVHKHVLHLKKHTCNTCLTRIFFLVMASLALDRCDVPRIILKRHLELPSNSVCRNSYLIDLGAPAPIHFPATSENTGKSAALFEDVASESGVPSIISYQLVSWQYVITQSTPVLFWIVIFRLQFIIRLLFYTYHRYSSMFSPPSAASSSSLATLARCSLSSVSP